MTSRSEPIRVTRFSTDDFAPQDRHEAWANRDWPAIGPVFDAVPIGPFHNRSDRFALGAVTVHVADMAPQRYERQAGRARRDGVDGLMVEILLAGETVGDAAGTETRNVPGGMVFNDLAQQHAHVSTGTRTVLLSIPRTFAERNGIDVHAAHGLHVSPNAAGLLRSHLLATHAALPTLSAGHADRLGQMTVDLMSMAVESDGKRAPAIGRRARDAATLLAAQRLIDDHLASPLLNVDWLCGRLGVSRSRLFRLFEPVGGVRAHVREQRLARIAAELGSPSNADRLADLADRWGFSDAAHLSRVFRARFGMTPGDYRESRRSR